MIRLSRRSVPVAASLALLVLATACSGDDEPEPAPTTTAPPAPEATSAPPPPTPAPTTGAPAAVGLSDCQQFREDLTLLTNEFVELVDLGNRALLLTIGQETSYEDGSVELDGIATRLREISAEVVALGDPPSELASRTNFVVQAVDTFAAGYSSASEAAALPDLVGLNQALGAVSRGTPLMQSASEAPTRCPED